MIKGFDLSDWQPVFTVDMFNQMKSEGFGFVILKLGENGYETENFRANMANAIQAGLKVGLYIYSHAMSTGDAINEANWTINKIQEIGLTNWHLQAGVWFDFENGDNHPVYDLDAQTRTDICATYYKALKDYGIDLVGVYIGYSLAWDDTYLYSQHPEIPIWDAEYFGDYSSNHTPDYPNPKIWQYTDREEHLGIQLDCNIMY